MKPLLINMQPGCILIAVSCGIIYSNIIDHVPHETFTYQHAARLYTDSSFMRYYLF